MKKIRLSVLVVLGFFVLPLLSAQDLITVTDLAKNLNNAKFTIVSAQPSDDFDKVHIKNAVNVPHKSLYKTGSPEGILLPANEIADILGKAGVSEKNTLVVYDEGSGKYAGRLYWILKYLGAPDVKVLDGNLEAWKAGRKPVTKNPTLAKAMSFTPKVNGGILALEKDILAGGPIILVDARSPEEYKGADGKSMGHLPGAVNMEYKEVLDDKGMMKSAAELQKLLASHGIGKDKTVILYCQTSVRAGIVYLALTSVLGYPHVKVYDGAYNEWIATSQKVEK